MANNRLYIGYNAEDEDDRCYILLSKGWGPGSDWQGWDGVWHEEELLSEFLNSVDQEATDIGGKTRLFLFTEYSDNAEEIFKTYKNFQDVIEEEGDK